MHWQLVNQSVVHSTLLADITQSINQSINQSIHYPSINPYIIRKVTLFCLSTSARNSLTNIRAMSIWPYRQAIMRAVDPFYQHTTTTYNMITTYNSNLLENEMTPLKKYIIYATTRKTKTNKRRVNWKKRGKIHS